jgi:nitroreductase
VQFEEVVSSRQSIRQYHDRPVSDDQLAAILAAVRSAPSAGNLQAYDVYVVRSHAARTEISHASHDQEFIVQAPLALVFCAVPSRSATRYRARGETLYSVQDATIACTLAMLAAVDQGLASVWVGAFDEERVRVIIGAPSEHRPVAILPIGHAAETPQRRARRPLDEIVHDAG